MTDNYPVKDGAGASKTFKSKDVAGVHVPQSIPSDVTGTPYASGNPLPVSGSIVPAMGSGGNLSVQTSATGTNYAALGSQACKQVTICNDSGVAIEVQQGGTGSAFVVLDQSYFTFCGLTNANQLAVRRKDTSNTQATLSARWEN